MIESRWNDDQARDCIARYAGDGGEDLALRVYSSRLLGADRSLVLHGGGNTSVKTTLPDPATGEPTRVLCVKGSGADLDSIEPAGLPALRLDALLKLRGLPRLTDEAMVDAVRAQLLRPSAPTPSVETLLHAFLPQRFVDHTHADAVLLLTNQPDGEALIRAALGDDVAILPWIMPGHPLAEAVADVVDAQGPRCRGVVLLHHGLFTFGDSARESYERMIELCSLAERFAAARLRDGRGSAVPAAPLDDGALRSRLATVLPVVRGALALPPADEPRRVIGVARSAADLVAFSQRDDARALCETGPLTPDHVIRTKARYLFLDADEAADPQRVRTAVARYAEDYQRYFEQNRARVTPAPTMLDPHPRVVVVAGLGLLAFGRDRRAAAIAADLAEHTLRVRAAGQALGRYTALDPPALFEMEYWSLEQRKLGRERPAPLLGQVALITGAAGAIGFGIASELLAAGAHLLLTDVDAAGLEAVAARLGAVPGRVVTAVADVGDRAAVEAVFDACAIAFGGVDLVVPNAGIAVVGSIADTRVEDFRRVVDVNLIGTANVLAAAQRVFERQRSGGAVVVQGSKNVLAPGGGFGAYSASKAAVTQLGKVAALEFAPLGVTVNTVHADAVFGDDQLPSGLWAAVGPERMRARGLDAAGLRAFYRERSLLKRAVRPADVGRAVVGFALATRTTGAALSVDSGLPEAFAR